MQSVYVESSVISYLTARPSKDIIISARQKITLGWWKNKRKDFDLFVSELVLEEITAGNPTATQLRLDTLKGIYSFEITSAAKELAHSLLIDGAVPANSLEDALHIGIAASQGADFLLTWNFKHINNASTRARITKVVEFYGYLCPLLCSPEEL